MFIQLGRFFDRQTLKIFHSYGVIIALRDCAFDIIYVHQVWRHIVRILIRLSQNITIRFHRFMGNDVTGLHLRAPLKRHATILRRKWRFRRKIFFIATGGVGHFQNAKVDATKLFQNHCFTQYKLYAGPTIEIWVRPLVPAFFDRMVTRSGSESGFVNPSYPWCMDRQFLTRDNSDQWNKCHTAKKKYIR